MRTKIEIRKLFFAFLLLLCTLFFSVVMTNCGYDNGTSSNFNGNDNMNDNNGDY